MKKKYWLTAMMMGMAALAMSWGCAQTGPGMEGSENSGVALHITSIDNGDPFVDVLSGLTPDTTLNGVDITVANDAIGTKDSEFQSGIFLVNYKIIYESDEPGSVDLDPLMDVGIGFYLDPGQEVTISGYPLVVPQTKLQYINRGGRLTPPVQYMAIITVFGVNEFGNQVKTTGRYPIYFADY